MPQCISLETVPKVTCCLAWRPIIWSDAFLCRSNCNIYQFVGYATRFCLSTSSRAVACHFLLLRRHTTALDVDFECISSAAFLKPMDCLWCSDSSVGKYEIQYLLKSGGRYQRLEEKKWASYCIGFCRNAATYMAGVWKLLGYCKREKLCHVVWANLFKSFPKALQIICINLHRRVQGSGKKGYYRLRGIQGIFESFARKWCKTNETMSLHKVLFTCNIGNIIYVQSV